MSVKTTKVLACEKCSANKQPTSHTYGKYKVIETTNFFSMRCSTCGYTIKILKFETLKDMMIQKIEDVDDIIYNQAKIIDIIRGIKNDSA